MDPGNDAGIVFAVLVLVAVTCALALWVFGAF